jgi:regulator of PEP synthase PpsR (kinase-PPPase family)
VSRSSKTPTAVYLANRGYKVANMPLVGQHAATARLSELRNPLVVGLTIAPDRLVAIRRNRLIAMGSPADTAYVDQALVAAEVMAARRLFADKGWPTIDVTRRSIEETAAAIINLMSAREEARPGFAP